MYNIKKNTISTFDIATYLNTTTFLGKDFDISTFTHKDEIVDNSITYIDDITIELLENMKQKIIVLTNTMDIKKESVKNIVPDIIFTDNPKRDFYLIIKEFFISDDIFVVEESVKIDKSVHLGINVNIGLGSKIGKNVSIGNNTYIGKDVIINDDVTIGSGCYLKDSSIIGSDSFNFIDENSRFSYIPCFGRLIIKDDVWIGSKVVIEKPSMGKNYIYNDVKIDDLVQIGSDVNIGKHTQIAAGSVIGRDVEVGESCLFGINTVIKPNLKIANNIQTGVGTVVITHLEENRTYIGNPAKILIKDIE